MKFKLLIFFILMAISCRAGTVITPAVTSTGSSGSVAAGYQMVSIATSSTFTGTILGATVTAGRFYTFSAPAGSSLPTIAYTVTAGSVEILTLK